MRPTEAPRPYVVRSRFATTGLTCQPSVAAEIDRLARPYLTVQPGTAGPEDWRVSEGLPPTPGAVAEPVTALGEPTVEYAVDHAERHVFHLAPAGPAWACQSLLRATRAVHRSAAARGGMLFLHAGLVELNGLGVALVGGSRAGKTSFVMAAVLAGQAVMVCNDDVSLAADATGGVLGAGWPRSVSVRLDTLDLLLGPERARAALDGLTHPANASLASLRTSGVERHGTALIYPWEYAALLRTRLGHSARVDALVHLSLADAPEEAELSAVSRRERRTLLDRHVLETPNKHLNIFGHEPEPRTVRRTRDALTALPTFRLRYVFQDVRRAVDQLGGHLRAEVPAA